VHADTVVRAEPARDDRVVRRAAGDDGAGAGAGEAAPAQAEFGTCQAGFSASFWIVWSPARVSRPTCPTAIEAFFVRGDGGEAE
jgi:hypothetical protein